MMLLSIAGLNPKPAIFMQGKKPLSKLIVLLFIASIGLPAGAQNSEHVVMKRLHERHYQAGGTVDVQIILEAPQAANVKAMGLRETLPAGWTFSGMRAVEGGLLPSVFPAIGSTGVLEFAWVDTPAFPYSFVYSVAVPEDDTGEAGVFVGQLEYRADGPAQFADPVVTSLEKAAWKVGLYLACAGAPAGAGSAFTDAVTILGVLCVLLVLSKWQAGGKYS